MKTKEQIVEDLENVVHWNYLKEAFPDRFEKEVERRVKISNYQVQRHFNQVADPLYEVREFLWKKRKEYQDFYERDIHGRENNKALDKVISIDFVLELLSELHNKTMEAMVIK